MPLRSSARTRRSSSGDTLRTTHANCPLRRRLLAIAWPLRRIAAIESGTHARRHRVDVLDLGRVGDDRIGVDGIGEQIAVAVDDVAAAAGRLDRVLALALRALHHRVVPNDLQIEEPRFDRAGPQRTDHGADHEPRAERVPPVGHG